MQIATSILNFPKDKFVRAEISMIRELRLLDVLRVGQKRVGRERSG